MTARAKGPWSIEHLERSQVKLGVTLLRKLGWRVYNLSATRRVNTTPGVPDLLAFHPVHGMVWWESKGMTGHQQTAPQQEFQAHCTRAGVVYVLGPFSALQAHLSERRAA